MSDQTAKRSSDDGVFDGVKKKKKKTSKDKPQEADVLKEKPVTDCNDGNTRQKKAFFAYFGKSFNEDKHADQPSSIGDGGNASQKSEVKNNSGTEKMLTDTDDDNVDCLLVPDEKNDTKQMVIQKKNTLFSANSSFSKNSNQPFVSSFIEEMGCFPKVTHTNHSSPISTSDYILYLNEDTSHYIDVKNCSLSFQTVIPVPEKLVLKSYQMGNVHLPYSVSLLKMSFPHFPVPIFHQYLRHSNLMASKNGANIESMWIDKYKPLCDKEVLGNSAITENLKNWLKPSMNSPNISKKHQRYYDDDDFMFESDSNSSHKAQHNLAILLGPSGCGKTSAVYAVASELNANVIELNASCNRNGKRIITDLMEATQSHAVEKNTLFNMIKEKKNKTKNLKKKEETSDKMTIILIEDADIFFENFDDGFLPAISTLATDSKRPLILTANDPFNNHLLKFFLSNEMVFNFKHPPIKDLNCYLQLMALTEGANMSEEEINTFINPFKPDIRQSILQLQYVINSGEIVDKTPTNTCDISINSLWWNWPYVIGCDLASIEKDNEVKCDIDLATISQKLDALSKLNLTYSKTQSSSFLDPQPFWHHLTTRDSASLYENHCSSDNSVQLSTDITQWIYNQINTQDCTSQNLYPSSEELSNRQKIWNTSKNVLEQIGLDYCNRKNETCFDYLATIRSFGRNQENQQFSYLRSSKIFSYLGRINIDINRKDLKFMCKSFASSSNCNQSVEISDQF